VRLVHSWAGGHPLKKKRRENGRNVTSFWHGLCGQQHGLAMNWVDQPRTGADERDVVRRAVVIVCGLLQGLVVFFIDLSFLREQSP